ncbi:MAG: hypothetical protein WKF58_15640 [Ilumatobacteraceae bacterium]
MIGTPADGDDTAIGSSNAVLYDLDNGDELASGEIRPQLSTASQDGCTVLAATADGALALDARRHHDARRRSGRCRPRRVGIRAA